MLRSPLVASHQKQPEILSSGAGLAAAAAAETGTELGEFQQVRARGYWEQVWTRFRRDKVAIAGGFYIIILLLIAFVGAPIASHFLGHGPNTLFFDGVDETSLQPRGPGSWVTDPEHGNKEILLLGADSTLGRDEFLRLLYGARVSLIVGGFATALSMLIGVLLGAIAGYYRGWIDTVVSRVTEITMAFPVLLFIIALASTVGDRLAQITLGGLFPPGVLTLVLVIGIFGWFYPARIIRAVVLSLREKEFIEAARMVGASDWRIIRSHLLPHLVAPIIVYSTLTIASVILIEAGLSFLGIGIKLPNASWGNMLSTGPEYYTTQPLLMVWPGMAVLFATLAFNLLGDGLRDAFDPRSSH